MSKEFNQRFQKENPLNIVRQMAEDRLPFVMEKLEVEDTPENRADILALALNSMPAKYITTTGGKLYTQLVDNYRIQYETDVITGLTKAAMKVKLAPRQSKRPGDGK
jgi:competence protein ComFB